MTDEEASHFLALRAEVAQARSDLRRVELERDIFENESRRLAWPTDAQVEINNLRRGFAGVRCAMDDSQAALVAALQRATTAEAEASKLRGELMVAEDLWHEAQERVAQAETARAAAQSCDGYHEDKRCQWCRP